MLISPIKISFDCEYNKFNCLPDKIKFTSQYLLFEDVNNLIKNGKIDEVRKLPDIYIINNKRESLLHSAAQNNQLEISKFLLFKNLDPNLKNFRGRTPFAIACSKLNKPMIEYFLLYNADVNTYDNQRNTPLHKVITSPQLIKLLLEHNANPYFVNEFNQSPFSLSLKYPESLETFLKCGTNPNAADKNSQTLMHAAIMSDNLDSAAILKKYGADINYKDNQGKSPIFYTENPQNILWLYKNGANLNLQDKDMQTVLHKHVINNNYNISKLLLKLNADPNLLDKEGLPPLAYAKNTKFMELLLQNKADPNVRTKTSTILHNCTKAKNTNAVNLLLKYHANPNITDNENKIPFDYVLNVPSLRTILLDAGSNPNHRNYLISALKINNNKFLTELLEHGANPNKQNTAGKTSAFFVNTTEQIEKLQKYNVNLNVFNNDGYSPLHHFALLGRKDIIEDLKNHGAVPTLALNGQTIQDCLSAYEKYHTWLKPDKNVSQIAFCGEVDSNHYEFYGTKEIREELLRKVQLTTGKIDTIIQTANTTEQGIITVYRELKEEEDKISKAINALPVVLTQYNEKYRNELQRLYSRNPSGSKTPVVGIASQYFGTVLTDNFKNNLIRDTEKLKDLYKSICTQYFENGVQQQVKDYIVINKYFYDGIKYVSYIEGEPEKYKKILNHLEQKADKLNQKISKQKTQIKNLADKHQQGYDKMLEYQKDKQQARTARKTATIIVGGGS